MTQAQHRASIHPRLRDVLDLAMERARQRFGVKLTYFSTARPQLDCSRVAGPCSPNSLHSSVYPARAADLGGWRKADVANWRRFAGLVREVAAELGEPCIEWAGERDANHFELDCPAVPRLVLVPRVAPEALSLVRALDPGNLTPQDPGLGRALAIGAVALGAYFFFG